MLNIIITHKGNPYYLKFVLSQLKETNENANIILMGDETNNKYPFIHHVLLSDYYNEANDFANYYQHRNSTSIEYELFCYQRWFCIYEYMKKHGLKDVFALDSDVLVYDNLEMLYQYLREYDFALSAKSLNMQNAQPGYWIAGPPLGYFKLEVLEDLCNFFKQSYLDPQYLNLMDIKMQYHQKRKEPFGICDMTQIYFFAVKNQDKFFNLSNIFTLDNEKISIDESILDTSNFVKDNNCKKFLINNKKVYAFEKESKQKIRFPLIHFQGYCPINAKEWIPKYYIGKRYRISLIVKDLKWKMKGLVTIAKK